MDRVLFTTPVARRVLLPLVNMRPFCALVPALALLLFTEIVRKAPGDCFPDVEIQWLEHLLIAVNSFSNALEKHLSCIVVENQSPYVPFSGSTSGSFRPAPYSVRMNSRSR